MQKMKVKLFQGTANEIAESAFDQRGYETDHLRIADLQTQ